MASTNSWRAAGLSGGGCAPNAASGSAMIIAARRIDLQEVDIATLWWLNGMRMKSASIASKIKWGILSTANIGVKRVIPAIIAGQRGVVFGIASRDAGRAANIAARFRIARSYGSYQALLDDPEIEAVYNPLPNHLHVEWTVKALDAGKHVLCEKPIGLNAAEAQAIVAARDRSGRRVIEAFMVRFHPQWHRIRALVRAGRVGTVRTIQSAFLFTVLDPGNVRNQPDIGGGALFDVGCYPIVTAHYVLG